MGAEIVIVHPGDHYTDLCQAAPPVMKQSAQGGVKPLVPVVRQSLHVSLSARYLLAAPQPRERGQVPDGLLSSRTLTEILRHEDTPQHEMSVPYSVSASG